LALIVNQDGFPFSYELFDGTAPMFPPSKRFCAPWNGTWESTAGLDL